MQNCPYCFAFLYPQRNPSVHFNFITVCLNYLQPIMNLISHDRAKLSDIVQHNLNLFFIIYFKCVLEQDVFV